jgi:ceramide glucosyltransferase
VLSDILLIVTLASLALTLGIYATVPFFLRRPRAPAGRRPPISVLKPLKGVDDGLYENLASFAVQRYPRFQIVCGVADPHDPAIEVVRRLQRDFPHADIVISTQARGRGRNPKVNNLAALSARARHPYWLISDSNTRVHPDYLAENVAEFFANPRVGLVTNLFVGTQEETVGAILENLELNSFVASAVCASQLLTKTPIVIGKSMMFRRDDLEALGGWAAVRDILAEDYVLGARFREAGFKVTASAHVVTTVNQRWGFRRFLNRHLRWCQMRRRMTAPVFFTENLVRPTLWAFLLACAGQPLPAAAVVAAKVAADAALTRRLRGHAYPLHRLLLIPFKDLLLAGVWLVAVFRRRVWWRDNPLWIGPGTLLLESPRAVKPVARPAPVDVGA